MDPKDRIPHDDWADQDLLTKIEAAERLAAEIKEIQAKLVVGDADDVMLRRLAALEESLDNMTSGGN
jgi:hypothetical protein